eukprot:Tbor_TRINITY_DN5971_c0_g1::TRINITY_DN5971_c0_g1_i3::g.18873::m.18873
MFCSRIRCSPIWKAPGTPQDRPGAKVVSEEDLCHPRAPIPKKNLQREGIRLGLKVGRLGAVFCFVFIIFPSHISPMYVQYVAGNEWARKAEEKGKSIWERRNERDHYYYMTQRKNTFLELIGLKWYNIGGDNIGDEVQKYK